MATKVTMEALSPTMEEGRLVKWTKNEGDQVKAGDVLAEVETDKAIMELVARGDGTLRKRLANEGDSSPVGTLLAVIAAPDENIDSIVGSAAPAAAPAATAASSAPPPQAPPAQTPAQSQSGALPPPPQKAAASPAVASPRPAPPRPPGSAPALFSRKTPRLIVVVPVTCTPPAAWVTRCTIPRTSGRALAAVRRDPRGDGDPGIDRSTLRESPSPGLRPPSPRRGEGTDVSP